MNDTAVFTTDQSQQKQIARSANQNWKQKHATGAKRGKTSLGLPILKININISQ